MTKCARIFSTRLATTLARQATSRELDPGRCSTSRYIVTMGSLSPYMKGRATSGNCSWSLIRLLCYLDLERPISCPKTLSLLIAADEHLHLHVWEAFHMPLHPL